MPDWVVVPRTLVVLGWECVPENRGRQFGGLLERFPWFRRTGAALAHACCQPSRNELGFTPSPTGLGSEARISAIRYMR